MIRTEPKENIMLKDTVNIFIRDIKVMLESICVEKMPVSNKG